MPLGMSAAVELSFRLRQALSWSPTPSATPLLRLSALRASLDAHDARRFDALERRRELEPLSRATSLLGAREALWATDTLDHLLGDTLLPPGPCLDVGAKNATHLPGQFAFRPGPWDLVEVDPHRRYVDLTTRGAHGKAMAGRFRGARYIARDIREVTGRYSLITWFLPFVVESPHHAWGLPQRLFAPSSTLAHVIGLLAEGGALVIVNQGEAEAHVQRQLLRDVAGDLDVADAGSLSMVVSPYQRERFGVVVRRPR